MKKSFQNLNIDLSVIIVNYNTGRFLEECLESVVRTTGGLKSPNVEVVVVDNASNDNSTDFLKRQKLNKNVVLVENRENVGFAKATNQGLKKSKGKYKLLLNPDTEVLKGAISALLSFVKTTEDVGIVAPRLLNPDGSSQPSVIPFPSFLGAIREFWFNQKNYYSKYLPQTDMSIEVDSVVGAAFLITPTALQKVGLLEERYFMYFEDLDYCRRIRNAGLKVYYLPSAKVVHYHGVSGKNLSEAENQWRRLIPSSKKYHGVFKHYLLNFVIWFGNRVLWRLSK